MDLKVETVERVRAYWRGWEAQPRPADTVSIVEIGHDRFVRTPDRLQVRLDGEEPDDLAALVAVLDDDVAKVVGEARLAYADATTFRPVPADGVIGLEDDDARLRALEASSDPTEWSESSADEPAECRFGIVDGDSLLAVAALQVWEDAFGHVSVFTATAARRRGFAAKVGTVVVERAFALGVVPQWRSRLGNDASASVADRLGFVPLGKQMTVRVKH